MKTLGKYKLVGREVVPVEDLMEWATWFGTHDRLVAQDTIGECEVSTVFIGLDYRRNLGPPIVFETLVFGGPLDGSGERSSTWEEAEAVHAKFCQRAREALN